MHNPYSGVKVSKNGLQLAWIKGAVISGLAICLVVIFVVFSPADIRSGARGLGGRSLGAVQPSFVAPTVVSYSNIASIACVEPCRVELVHLCESPRIEEQEAFSNIYANSVWGTWGGSHTKSGGGSTLGGAYDTMFNFEKYFAELNITSIADIPSGDLGWQFGVTAINTAEAYFGGDIAASVAADNAVRYKNHLNKVFHFWDLATCPIPQWRTTCDPTPRNFDIVNVRDVIQHMNIKESFEAIRLIVLQSEVTYLSVTSFSKDTCNECRKGDIETGSYYFNNFHCKRETVD